MKILGYSLDQKWVFFNLSQFLCSATYGVTISNKVKQQDLANIYYHCNKVEIPFVLHEKLCQRGPFPENFNRVAKIRRGRGKLVLFYKSNYLPALQLLAKS